MCAHTHHQWASSPTIKLSCSTPPPALPTVYEGSIVADVIVTAPADEATQAALVEALVTSPDALFDDTFRSDFAISGPVSGRLVSSVPATSVVILSDPAPARIGVGVGVGVGGAIGVAGFATAFYARRAANQRLAAVGFGGEPRGYGV